MALLGVSGVSHLCGTPSRRPVPPKDLDREKIEGDKGEMYRDQAHVTDKEKLAGGSSRSMV